MKALRFFIIAFALLVVAWSPLRAEESCSGEDVTVEAIDQLKDQTGGVVLVLTDPVVIARLMSLTKLPPGAGPVDKVYILVGNNPKIGLIVPMSGGQNCYHLTGPAQQIVALYMTAKGYGALLPEANADDE